jgi:hypothetical protein
MKTWQKMIVVVACGGTVWGLSYLSSLQPDMAMMLASVNAAVVAVCSYVTGFPAKNEVK